MADFDWILVGGGLQNGLLALALATHHPGERVVLIEKGETLGGNHTWSFHADDVPDAARDFVEPLIRHRWPSYVVTFPGFERRLSHPYASFTSDHLHDVVIRAFSMRPGFQLLLGQTAARVSTHEVVLSDGRVLAGRVVVDARGPTTTELAPGRTGFQKFVGLELALENDSPVREPVMMDATVPQTDGFRFMYTLPFEPRRLLVEDTYFSNSPTLDVTRLRYEVLSYAFQRGCRVKDVIRQETGVLPMPLGPLPEPNSAGQGPLRAGYGGGWFHPATGYSFPVALRLALYLAMAGGHPREGRAFARLSREHRKQARFCHLLNRLFFLGIDPAQRWATLARFYALPDDTIRRFYALNLTRMDRTRILMGRPPRGMSLRGMWAAMEA